MGALTVALRNPSVACLLAVCILTPILFRFYRTFKDPLWSVPGPTLARFTKYWYTKALARGDFQRQNIELHRKYGPIVRIGPDMYSFQDLTAMATIYQTQNVFPKSRWYFTFQLPEEPNIFSTHSNRLAADLRRKYKPAYDAVYSYEPAVDNCSAFFEKKLRERIEEGKADNLNLGWWLTCFAFDVNGEIGYSKRFGHLDEGKDVGNLAVSLADRLDYCTHVGVYPSLHPWFWALMKLLSVFVKQIDYTYVFTAERMAEFEEQRKEKQHDKSPRPADMLTRFYDLHYEDPKAFTKHDVLIGAYPSITGDADTSWISLGSVIYYLHRHPATLAKLRHEIDSFASDAKISDPVTFDEAKKMPYLQAVIKEAQRLHSPAGLPLWRIVPEGGATLAGRFFPEGTTVGVNAWVSHYSDVFSPDPDIFRPERWLDSDKDVLSEMNRAHITFGMGPRNCQGQLIAMMEMSKIVPQLIRRFDFELVGDWELYNHWLVSYKNLNANFRLRT